MMRRVAFALYVFFTASWFLHLTSRVSILGTLRADLAIVVIVTALLIASSAGEGWSSAGDQRPRKALVVLILYVVVTLPLVEWPGSVLWFGVPAFCKALVFYFFTAQLIDSKRRLGILLVVFVASETFRVLEPVYLHVTQGYWGSHAFMGEWGDMDRLSGAPSDTVNPNGLASVILVVLPFWHYLAPLTRIGGLAYATVLPVLLYALALTGSRSGMLGLVMTLCVIWAQTRRKVLVAAVILVGAVISASQLSENLSDRYLSIVDSDTRNAVTARGRIEGIWTDLSVVMRRPLFGHGLGTSAEASANFAQSMLPSHNLYTEVGQELGFIGLAVFLFFLSRIVVQLVGVSRRLRAPSAPRQLAMLSRTLNTWFAMNVLFSFASYGLSSYEWYFLAGLLQVIERLYPAAAERPAAEPERSVVTAPLERAV